MNVQYQISDDLYVQWPHFIDGYAHKMFGE